MSEKKVIAPLHNCPVCNGTGQFYNENKEVEMDCPCIFLSEVSPYEREEMMLAYNDVLENSKPKVFELPSNFTSLTKEQLSDALSKMGDVHKAVREQGAEEIGKMFPTAVKWMTERGYDQLFSSEFERMSARTVSLH